MTQRSYEILGPDFHVVGSIEAERFPLLVRLLDKLSEELRREEAKLEPTFEPMKHS